MYIAELRRTWKRTLWVTISVAVTSAIVISWVTNWSRLPQIVLYQLLVSACVGLLFWINGPIIRSYGRNLKPIPWWTFRIVSGAVILNLGVLIGLAALAALGAFSWSVYWTTLWESVVPTTVIGVTCAVAFIMYDTLQYKAQYETAQARLSSLESRLRPHFLFNTLNSIMALIPEDPDAAERMTERLAALLRYSLDATDRSTVRLEQELKVATDYLEIEKTRFGERMQYSIDVPQELMTVAVPPFSLQTLVENSVKYGGGEIRISAHNGNGRLLLRVWDSGEGFPHDAPLPSGHGLHNLKDRLDALWGSKAAVEFPAGESGTTVQVSLPASTQ
jgi:two-component system, LytTR family, sensor histidine kinase AlgZ